MLNTNDKHTGYMVRRAAGAYYLVFLDRSEFRRPLQMNDSAYFIFSRYTDGKDERTIAEDLAKEYEVSVEDTLSDVETFITELKNKGINVGE